MMRPTVTKSRESSGATAILAVRCSPARVVRRKLVKMMHASFVAESLHSFRELQREYGAQRLAQGFSAAEGIHGLHLRVPALDAVVEVDSEDADIDGFDDVFVELFQPFELG